MTTGSFTGAAGGRIHWRSWGERATTGRVVIAHGYGEHGDRYARYAERLTATGLRVWAPDHRGHGRSEGPRGLLRLRDAAADLRRVAELSAEADPGTPLVVLGHSMGGAIALRHALDHQDDLAGLVLSAPPVSLTGTGVNAVQRAAAAALAVVVPRLPVHRLSFDNLTRDHAELQAYLEDPLVHRGAQPARTVADLLDAMAGFPGEVAALRVPLLVLHGTEDRLTLAEGSREIADRAGSEDVTYRRLEGVLHEPHNEPEPVREAVMADVVAWVSRVVAAAA